MGFCEMKEEKGESIKKKYEENNVYVLCKSGRADGISLIIVI